MWYMETLYITIPINRGGNAKDVYKILILNLGLLRINQDYQWAVAFDSVQWIRHSGALGFDFQRGWISSFFQRHQQDTKTTFSASYQILNQPNL